VSRTGITPLTVRAGEGWLTTKVTEQPHCCIHSSTSLWRRIRRVWERDDCTSPAFERERWRRHSASARRRERGAPDPTPQPDRARASSTRSCPPVNPGRRPGPPYPADVETPPVYHNHHLPPAGMFSALRTRLGASAALGSAGRSQSRPASSRATPLNQQDSLRMIILGAPVRSREPWVGAAVG
jgi:hypothetical protein